MIRPRSAPLAVLAALAVAVAGSLSTPAGAQVVSPGRVAPVVTVTGSNSPFSPNSDGSKDRGAVTYRLADRAFVTVRVTGGGVTVLTKRLGRQAKGAHIFTWDGKRAGRLVSDGTYAVAVLSRRTRHGHAREAHTPLVVDARYGSLGIGSDSPLSSTVVYPRTTVIHDVVVGGYAREAASGDTGTIRRWVLSQSGRLVDSAPLSVCTGGCSQRYTWDGRDRGGAVVPPGRYRIELVQGRDRAGNPRVLVPQRTVTVSPERLVTRTTTLSATASATTRRDVCDGPHAALGCPEVTSPSVASARFPGGVSYPSVQRTSQSTPPYTFYTGVVDNYLVPVSGRSTPYDTFTVTAYGGPSTPGDDDTGTLSASVESLQAGTTGPADVMMQGDTTGTLHDVPSLGMTDPLAGYPGGIDGPVLGWSFGTGEGNSYDVASFDVSYTRYVLP